MARIAIMALESLEDNSGTIQEPVDTTVDEAADAVIDINELQGGIDDIQDSIEEASATIGTLDDVAVQMKVTLPEGGVEPEAAEVISAAVEHMCTRLGFKKNTTKFALEGFKSKTTRVQATQIAMEGIQKWVTKIWQAIVNFFNKAVKWVKNFINKTFDAAKKLKQRAIALKKKAEEKRSTKDGKKAAKVDKDGIVEEGWFEKSWGEWLCHDGKYLSDINAIISKQKELVTVTSAMDVADKVLSDTEEYISSASKAESVTGDVNSEAYKTYSQALKKVLELIKATGAGGDEDNKSDLTADEGCVLKRHKVPLGMAYFYTQTPVENNNGDNIPQEDEALDEWLTAFGKTKIFFKKTDEDPQGNLVTKVMSIENVIAVANETISAMSKYNGYNSKLNQINAKQDKIASKAEEELKKADHVNPGDKISEKPSLKGQVHSENTAEITNKANDDKHETNTKKQDFMMKVSRELCKVALQISTQALSGERGYQINAHRGVLDYADKSLDYWD
jgi:hypothetical protein